MLFAAHPPLSPFRKVWNAFSGAWERRACRSPGIEGRGRGECRNSRFDGRAGLYPALRAGGAGHAAVRVALAARSDVRWLIGW
jgi:hypothetical protein